MTLTPIAPNVFVATSRFLSTNTTVVVDGDRSLVIDPGVHLDELDELASAVRTLAPTVEGGFATHAHWDHVLWHRDLGDGPRWATRQTVSAADREHGAIVETAEQVTPVTTSLIGSGLRAVADALPWTGPAAVIVEHNAHAIGHAALHFPDLGLLLAGDMTSDVEPPLLDFKPAGPDALASYHEGLERLAALDNVDLVVTGHGNVCDGPTWRARIDADRRYLDAIGSGQQVRDARVSPGWIQDAHDATQERLSKPAWRTWATALGHVVDSRPSVDALLDFLGTPGLVGLYVATVGEVDVEAARLALDGVVLPRLDDATNTVTWHRTTEPLVAHRFGFLQPPAHAPRVEPAALDALVVPGRAFDELGIRLGRGGGHYDRTIPQLRPGTPVVGATVDERVVHRLPREQHDAPMTHLATQSGVRSVGGS